MAGDLLDKCFVVGPIGDEDSDVRIHADWLFDGIIAPSIKTIAPDMEIIRADKIATPGIITSQIIIELIRAKLVIADLTHLNPNALYEIGIRHALNTPIIHMHMEGTKLPFDVASFRSIPYSYKRHGDIGKAKDALQAYAASTLEEKHQVDNPVTSARGRIEFSSRATPPERMIQDDLDALSTRVQRLEVDLAEKNNILEALYPPTQSTRRIAIPRARSAMNTQNSVSIKFIGVRNDIDAGVISGIIKNSGGVILGDFNKSDSAYFWIGFDGSSSDLAHKILRLLPKHIIMEVQDEKLSGTFG
ncbi:hypothetical protein [Segnochrobactrum spirostomi]|uniref:Uncharacterized protein n=1 Tax=Segnochrobactrum spirostomi TaxID=2608987 RepID=A0A6A7Y8V6_9HYPH|nr:hypothetical protein [Segnochrobactrum spirostomi]MQT14082.1 hypothetical protein [Segnochrobactrum spirostomi]